MNAPLASHLLKAMPAPDAQSRLREIPYNYTSFAWRGRLGFVVGLAR
ncbi:MAG: hypothetical protein RI904_431 [Pseudomonadota bacterium]